MIVREECAAETIHVVGHSMGSVVVTYALKSLRTELDGEGPRVS